MISAKFAESGSAGALATEIGWIDFGPRFALVPDALAVSVSNSLPDGYTVTFDVRLVNNGGTATNLYAVIPPTYSHAPLGNTSYTGIDGNVVLYSTHTGGGSADETIEISNIVVKNSKGVQTTTYQIVAADGETTDGIETLSFNTNGSVWALLDNLPPTSGVATSPIISGVGTTSVLETGVAILPWVTSGPVFLTNSPTKVSAVVTFSQVTQQGVAFGIIITARQQAISDLIESVALEQAALSHILNAEGEKLQKLIGLNVAPDQLLGVNNSVQSMVNSVSTLEMVLQSKLSMFNPCLCERE
ncbi:CshA/CshB family fibrillar adhesin-related protein [Oscillospiraceae bacterium PP1C4]